MMVPASLFTNNSEQIFSNINNKVNNTNNISETENIDDKNRNTSLLNGKIKIIEKQLSNKNNDDIKNEINMKQLYNDIIIRNSGNNKKENTILFLKCFQILNKKYMYIIFALIFF